MKITDRLAAFCADISVALLPADVIERTPLLLLDLIGYASLAQDRACIGTGPW